MNRSHNPEFTPDEVRRLVRYDGETGKLYWLPRSRQMFSGGSRDAELLAALWNGRWAGKEAFTTRSHGYFTGHLLDKKLQAHRVAWAIAYGEWPNFIDHINRDRGDNRLSNLRAVTRTENQRNHPKRSDNSSGVSGVYWDANRKRWSAYINTDKRVSLGRFETMAEAIAARRAAEKVLGYHPTHGRSNPLDR